MDRLQLQALLEQLLGSPNVYFQPPPSKLMQYPCIVYHRDTANTLFADNAPYRYTKKYQVTVIDRNPDSLIPDRVAKLPLCTHNRKLVVDNLNQDIFSLYY